LLFYMKNPPRLTRAKAAEREARDRRLAEALRENLHRRKEQARGKREPAPAAAKAKDEPPA
jgi:hypothetical protein